MIDRIESAMRPYQEVPGPAVDFESSLCEFEDKLIDTNVIITGGGSGIGKACATAFLRYGAYVTIADLDTNALSETRQELSELFLDRIQVIVCNVTDWASQVELFDLAAKFGPKGIIDVVIPCASPGGSQFSFDTPELASGRNDLTRQSLPPPSIGCVQVGLVGTMYTAQLAVWYMARKRDSLQCLIMVSSMTTYRGIAGSVDYTGAKYGVRGLFKALRDSPQNLNKTEDTPALRINMLCPGYIFTPLIAARIEDILETGVRLSSMEKLVDGVIRMAADKSIHGKAVGVGPDGCYDIRDDIHGLNGMKANAQQDWFDRQDNINRSRVGIW